MGILCVIFGYSYLKSSSLFDNDIMLFAVYKHVAGLQSGTAVSINGKNVGTVNSIKFKDASGNLLVTFSVNRELKFSKNSTVELYDTGLIGGKGLRINPVFEGQTVSKYDTLKTIIKPGLADLAEQKLSPIFEKLEFALSDADSVMLNVNQVLDTQTKEDLQKAISGLSNLMVSLNNSAEVLNKLLKNSKLDSSLENLNNISSNFSKLSDSFNNAGLDKTLASLETTVTKLDDLMGRIEKGEGTLGKLAKDEALYNNLSNASKELDLLLQDFRLNPKRYVNVSVFGKKQKEYTVPEEDPAEKIDN